MGTLVCFHAHPDDEAISTGGSMARAHHEGHRVVLVVATDGAHGEVPDDLSDGESLADRRRAETACSARALGVDRVEWLGYTDSGMTGWQQNDDPSSFHQAEIDAAAQALAAILLDESADVLTIYDWHGNYGHPDHVKVHQVGVRAAQLLAAELPGLRVFEATINRDEFSRMIAEAAAAGLGNGIEGVDGPDFDPDGPADDGNPFGMPEAELTHVVDVSRYVAAKRDAIACHRSQMSDSSFFLNMDAEQFSRAFGREWFIEHGGSPPMRAGWLFE
jgi:LmbE family N-acetylglucosaminyl deacetylase